MHKVTTLKDKDILKRKRKLYIPESVYDPLMKAIEADSKFLSQFECVAYHLFSALAHLVPLPFPPHLIFKFLFIFFSGM
jgi:hypothetical protein